MRCSVFSALGMFLLSIATCANAQPTDVYVNVTFDNLGALMISGGSINVTVLMQQLQLLQLNDPAFFAGVTLDRVVNLANGASVNVKLCGQGYYSDSALSTCIACPAGTYSSVYLASNADTCAACPAGSYGLLPASISQAACILCPANTYQPATRSSSIAACTPCTPNAQSNQGSTSIAACGCVAGYYDPGDGTCLLCPQGSFCASGVRNVCSQDGTQTSNAGSSSVSQCYCRAGYYYDSTYSPTIFCSLCQPTFYCPGGQGVMPILCPNGAASASGASAIGGCQCQPGYKQLTYGNAIDSSPRSFAVSADQCICSLDTPCGLEGVTPTNCCQDLSVATDNTYVCMGQSNGRTSNLTCAQGAVQLWYPGASYYYINWNQYWLIAPPGAAGIILTFVSFKTYDANDYLMIYTCDSSLVCGNGVKKYGSSLPPTMTISSGIVKLWWHTDGTLNSNGFQLTYTSTRACTPMQIAQTGSWVVPGLAASMPLRAWAGDVVDITVSGPLYISLAKADGSGAIATMASQILTQLPTPGVFTLTDSQYPARSRTFVVSPLEPTTWNMQVTPVGTGVISLVFAGDATGTNPDLHPTIGDKLSFTWLTQANYMVIGNATAGYAALADGAFGLVGSRSQQVTWDTSNAPAGVYYYALQSAPTAPKGRIYLMPRPVGITCVQCQSTEICYQGNVLACPANSLAAAGSTASDISGCLCQPGFYTATTDLLAYANGQNIDTGGRHSCAITEGNLLYCWGANEASQLGLRWGSTQEPPTLVNGINNVISVALGADFTCAVHTVGNRNKTRCWGNNQYGQLAHGDVNQGTSQLWMETEIPDAKLGTDYSVSPAIACADYSCCAYVTSFPPGLGGQPTSGVKCWGKGYIASNVDDGMPFLAVSVYPTVWLAHGGSHACAVQSNPATGIFVGNVVCWGDNQYGQAGIGSVAATVTLPTGAGSATPVNLPEAAKTVSCYTGVCCAVLKSLGVQCWGRGGDGRLGTGLFNIGSTASSMGANLPYVELGVNTLAMDVNVNAVETCALLSNNHVKCWGLVGGQLIQMTEYLPTLQLQENRGVLQLSGRGAATCAVLSNYKAVCWGSDSLGQLGRAVPGVSRRSLLAMDYSDSVGQMPRRRLLQANIGFNSSNMTLVPLPYDVLHSSGAPQTKSCAICQDNYYCDGGSSGNAILQCTQNAVSLPQSISSEACHCADGYSGIRNAACAACGGATYCASGIAFSCRLNSLAPPLATQAAQCACKPGYTSSDSNACVACPAGAFKEGLGDGACLPCPAGTNSSVQALGNGTRCAACPAGYSTASTAGAVACSQCQAGYFAQAAAADCTQCAAGSWSNQAAGACQQCPAGTYGLPGFTTYLQACIPCVAGKYSNLTAATSSDACLRCPAGTYSSLGASSCIQCAANTFAEEASQACLACPANSTSSAGSGASGCTCAAGFTKNAVTGTCDICGAGTWAAAASTVCTLCAAGTAQPLPGQKTQLACQTCAAGRWSASGAAACASCASTTISGAGASQCTQCQMGYYANLQVNATTCLPCPAGTYSLTPIATIFKCNTCLLGSYCPGLGSLVACPQGTYTNRTGNSMASQCLLCPPGYYCPMPSVRSQCPTGTASPAPGGATSQMQCACKPGYACDYSKFLEAVITLNIPASRFDCVMGQCDVRDAFIAAVAASAGVPAKNVIIIQIEDMSPTGPARRLLAAEGRIRIHVLVGVQDAERLHELDMHLQRQGLAASVDHGWYTPHEVKAWKM